MLPIEDEAVFQKIVMLRDDGLLHDAMEVLQPLIMKYPAHAGLWLFSGHLHKEAKEYSYAIQCFAKATTLRPDHELASLGLFHSLWKNGLQVEALQEAERFLALADCPDYRDIIQKIDEVE